MELIQVSVGFQNRMKQINVWQNPDFINVTSDGSYRDHWAL
jgi:hypothetical protein